MKFLIFIAFSLNLLALDIDEKLTLRILKVSETKRTILINRGIEDGLSVGDHAKLYLTTGMIARAVVVKTSPSRSVWSIYRLITPSEIVKNRVVNLKIATPVKITSDPTRMITLEPVIRPGRDIPVDNSYAGINSEAQEIQSLREDERMMDEVESQSNLYAFTRTSKVWEGYVSGYFNNLSTVTENDTANNTNSGSTTGYDLNVGFEKYFKSPGSWYENLSLSAFISLANSSSTNSDGDSLSNSFFGFGAGANYHFYNNVLDRGKLIGFGLFNFGLGSVTEQTDSALISPEDRNGGASFFAIGGGVKYYVNNFGIKTTLEYYRRVESYTFDDGSELIKTLSGPRVQFALLYRF